MGTRLEYPKRARSTYSAPRAGSQLRAQEAGNASLSAAAGTMLPGSRPEWTKKIQGIPIDCVVRIHGGAQGAASHLPPACLSCGGGEGEAVALGSGSALDGGASERLIAQSRDRDRNLRAPCARTITPRPRLPPPSPPAEGRQDIIASRNRVSLVRPGSLQPKP